MRVPCRRAASIASRATAGVVADSAAKTPPVWNQRRAPPPAPPNSASQSTAPGCSWAMAVWPRSEQPTPPRGPKPRSVKLRPLRLVAADAVVLDPAQVRQIDAPLQHQILDQPADRVVGQRGDDRGAQPEAAAQAARDVVLAAALPRGEAAGGVDAPLAGIEAQHHLAQAHLIETARSCRLDDEVLHAGCCCSWRRARARAERERVRAQAVRVTARMPQSGAGRSRSSTVSLTRGALNCHVFRPAL